MSKSLLLDARILAAIDEGLLEGFFGAGILLLGLGIEVLRVLDVGVCGWTVDQLQAESEKQTINMNR